MGGGLGRVANHPEYYLSDGSVSFLTSGVLFRVHRSFFERESEVFRELFKNAENDNPPSGTDARPFTLDVAPDEFSQFLWVWYDRDYSYGRQSKEKWMTILRLATRWEFERIRELAVRELEGLALPPAEMISIYNNHGINGEQVISSFVELCKSPTLPTEADARFLQMEALIKVIQAREEAQNKAAELGHESPTSACLEDEALREIVSRLLSNGSKGLDSRPGGGHSTGSGDQAQNPKPEIIPTKDTPILNMPQMPDRTTKLENGTSSLQTSPEKQGQEAKVAKPNGKVEEGENSEEIKKLEKSRQEKKKEEKEKKERLKKEKEEKENAERLKREPKA